MKLWIGRSTDRKNRRVFTAEVEVRSQYWRLGMSWLTKRLFCLPPTTAVQTMLRTVLSAEGGTVFSLWSLFRGTVFPRSYNKTVKPSTVNLNLNLFCVRLIHRGYDPSDMELVNRENNVTNILYDIRYNTINFRIQLTRRHSDYNVIAEGLY
jgi:hypothetical protein